VEFEWRSPPDAAHGVVLGVRQDTTKKGTTVTNNYQKNTPKTSAGPGLAVPDEVTVAMVEIADDMREGLLALASASACK
jgi:hypothetical protein